ncbi:MAG: recombinase family protein [Prevotella sp.]|nr:recombinase family protein [Prevotella sp.]
MANVILYCRVSTDEQADGCSLDMQERYLRAYCNNHHYIIIGEEQPYKEDYSAKHYDLRRPKLKQIYDYCRKHRHEVDKILFLRWDRFTRNLEFALTYKRKFYDELGIEINAIESPIDFKGAEWSMMLGMYCGVAHTEDEKISRRTRDGIHGTLLKGRCPNKAPRGYINKRTESGEPYVDIDETQAKTISQAFKEVAKGVETANCIRRRLYPSIPRETFFRMLHNIFYTGQIRVPAYNDEPEQIVKGLHNAIIDTETFNKVQDIISGKRKSEPKLSKAIDPDLFLRKYIVCPICGHSITGATSTGKGGKYKYYNCCHDGKHLRKPAGYVNDTFANWVGGLRPNQEVLDLYTEVLQDLRGEHKQDVQKEVDKLRKEVEHVEALRNGADDKFCEGTLSSDAHVRITERYERQIQDLQGRIELLQADTKQLKEKIDYSVNIIANLRNFMIDAPVKVKCKVLSSMFPQKIEFDGEKYRTHDYNKVLDLIFQETNKLRGYGEKESEKSEAVSHSVPRPRIELGTKL